MKCNRGHTNFCPIFMKAQFSEFSYGFTLTHELAKLSRNKLRAAPEFPSLLEEGKAGGGYDVRLTYGRPLLLQFKLSEFMKGESLKLPNKPVSDFLTTDLIFVL